MKQLQENIFTYYYKDCILENPTWDSDRWKDLNEVTELFCLFPLGHVASIYQTSKWYRAHDTAGSIRQEPSPSFSPPYGRHSTSICEISIEQKHARTYTDLHTYIWISS